MRIPVIAAATIALLSTTALVGAQQMQEPRGGQPSAKDQGQAPGGKMEKGGQSGAEKGAQRAPGGTEGAGKSAQGGVDTKDKAGDAKGMAEPKDKAGDTKRSAQDKAGDTKRSAQDKADDTKRSAQDKADDTKRTAKDKADDTKDRAAKDKAGDRDRDQARGKDGDRDQARGKDGDRDQARGDRRDGDRVNLTQNQRTEVREKLGRHREARVTNVNFSINIGTRVPRDFRLHVIPQDIVTIVPAYRGYRYFIVEERVVIVHPTSYEIVEVIEVDGPRRGGTTTASLNLTQAQIALILDSIPSDRRSADVSVELALGAEVPSSVELYEFPTAVVSEVPTVRQYRYVVAERRVLIVDPSGRDVVHVIDR